MEKLSLNTTNVILEYNKLKNIHKVAEHFNVSISPVIRILKENGITISNRRYFVNSEFFNKIDNEINAYWLGFLYADGYIRERKNGNSLELKLSIKDADHLERFRDDIGSSHRIIHSISKVKYKGGISESQMCHLSIYSNELVESIKVQGIHSRKTFTIQLPDIDESLMNHFIRGYFDGDGSFTFNPSIYKIHTNIVCASNNFREKIMNILIKHHINVNDYGRYTLHIQGKIGNLNFYNYLYNNATLFLTRKKEKYEKFREYYKYHN